MAYTYFLYIHETHCTYISLKFYTTGEDSALCMHTIFLYSYDEWDKGKEEHIMVIFSAMVGSVFFTQTVKVRNKDDKQGRKAMLTLLCFFHLSLFLSVHDTVVV